MIRSHTYSDFRKSISKYLEKLEKNLFVSTKEDENGDEITPERSKQIFEEMIKSNGLESKIDIQMSEEASPVAAEFNFIENFCSNCVILSNNADKIKRST